MSGLLDDQRRLVVGLQQLQLGRSIFHRSQIARALPQAPEGSADDASRLRQREPKLTEGVRIVVLCTRCRQEPELNVSLDI